MFSVLRFLRLISLVVWVGGIVFFAFVVAPVAFRNLPSGHEAGIVVRGTLHALHYIGVVCGLILLGATFWMRHSSGRKDRGLLTWQIVFGSAMMLTTLVSQHVVLPAMERDRPAGAGIIEALGNDDPRRIDFERLHILSERLEGAVLLFGLGIVTLMAREDRVASIEL